MKTDQLINQLLYVHNGRYNYVTNTPTLARKDKICIVCPDHGLFQAKVHDHLYHKSGCPACAHNRKRTNFVERAIDKFGNTFDYTEVVYTNNSTPVRIGCPTHGEFNQIPSVHLASKFGCPQCRIKARTKLLDVFIEEATKVHGNVYTYDNVIYITTHQRVDITCLVHGNFLQTPDNHLSGAGCPRCAGDSLRGKYVAGHHISPNKPGIFYVARFSTEIENFIKIGITSQKSAKCRYGNIHCGYTVEYLMNYNFPIYQCNEIERKVLRDLAQYRYKPTIKFGGYTECLDTNVELVYSTIERVITTNSQDLT